MNFFIKNNRRETTGCPCSPRRRLKIWRRIGSTALCAVLLGTSIGGPLTAAAGAPPVIVENGGQTDENALAVADTQTDPNASVDANAGDSDVISPEENKKGAALAPDEAAKAEEQAKGETEAVYTLFLTHYFRFTVNGESRNVKSEETIELTEADFEDGVCDLNRFAYDAR